MSDMLHASHLVATISMVWLSAWVLLRFRRVEAAIRELWIAPQKLRHIEEELRWERQLRTDMAEELLQLSARVDRLEGIPQGGPYR